MCRRLKCLRVWLAGMSDSARVFVGAGTRRSNGRGPFDVMVDGSIRGERLRPLGLWWTAARGRESRQLREPAGRLGAIWDWWAWRNGQPGSGYGLEGIGPKFRVGKFSHPRWGAFTLTRETFSKFIANFGSSAAVGR